MKISKLLMVSTVALTLALNNAVLASENATGFNVAIVNIEQIVESSPKINALKAERKNKLDGLAQFIEQANADLKKETNDAKRKTMEEDYSKELNKRREVIDRDFSKKLADIDTEITALIKAKGKKGNFNLILNKTSVIDGGFDITPEVIKELK